MREPMHLPYQGLSVVDMSQGIAGPYCGAILGLQGANVIKVEPPNGDWVRLLGGGQNGLTALSIASNFGKRSISIDAKKTEGRALIQDMASRADVFIENFRPGVIKKLGLDYETLNDTNPKIIYVSITGFGESGPWVDKPGTDSVLQAFTGMALVNKDDAGTPRRLSIPIPDTVTAMYAAQAVGAALFARHRDGTGRHISLSLAECCAAFQTVPILDEAIFKGKPRPPTNVPTGMFATADGYMAVLTLRDEMWAGLCKGLGRDNWLIDPLFANHVTRGNNAKIINKAVAEILLGKTTQEWIDIFEKNDVLCGEVLDYSRFRDHPQTAHMGYFGPVHQAPFEDLSVPYLPGSARGNPVPPAPRVGEHSRLVLQSLGYTAERIAELENSQIVFQES